MPRLTYPRAEWAAVVREQAATSVPTKAPSSPTGSSTAPAAGRRCSAAPPAPAPGKASCRTTPRDCWRTGATGELVLVDEATGQDVARRDLWSERGP